MKRLLILAGIALFCVPSLVAQGEFDHINVGAFADYFRSNATFQQFTNAVTNLRSQNMNGAVMPGGGLEGLTGPVGLRLDVGDEMYFNHGTQHNLKITFGPYVRF